MVLTLIHFDLAVNVNIERSDETVNAPRRESGKSSKDLVSANVKTAVNIIGFDVDNEGQI